MLREFGKFVQIGFPDSVREVFEICDVIRKNRGGYDPFGMDDFENGAAGRRIVEADFSVVASVRYVRIAENRRLREDPASGFGFRKERSVPIEMVEVFIRTSNENPLTEGQCFGIDVERRGVFPEVRAGLGIETAELSVETSEKNLRTVGGKGGAHLDGRMEAPLPNGRSSIRVEPREIPAVRAAVDRSVFFRVCR